MSLLPEDKKEQLRTDFKEKLVDPVKLIMFTQEMECRFCSETRQLTQDMATVSDKITVDVYDFVKDAQKAQEYGITRIPAIAIIGKVDHGVRIYGIPFGYELQTLVEGIINVSRGTTDLSDKTKGNHQRHQNTSPHSSFRHPHMPTLPRRRSNSSQTSCRKRHDTRRRH